MLHRLLGAAVIATCALAGPGGSAQSGADAIAAGTWTATPIVRLQDPAPATGGVFAEFGEHSWVDAGILVFWARFDDKHWALYSVSLKDHSPTLIARNAGNFEKGFDTPDGGQHRAIFRASKGKLVDQPASPAAAGRRLYYFQPSVPVVYGWDGSRIVRVIGAGDALPLPDGRSAVVDTVALANVSNDGRVLIYVATKKPASIVGWFFHDGATLAPFLMTDEPLRPLDGVTIRRFQKLMDPGPLQADPLIFDDGTLVPLWVDHAPFKEALFRLTSAGAEKLLASNDPDPRTPKEKVGDITGVYASDASHVVVLTGSNPYGQKLLAYVGGNWKTIVADIKDVPGSKGFDYYRFDDIVSVGPHADRFLVSVHLRQSLTDVARAKKSLLVLSAGALTEMPSVWPVRLTRLPANLGVGIESMRSLIANALIGATKRDAGAASGDSAPNAGASGGAQYLAPGSATLTDSPRLNAAGGPFYLANVVGLPDPDHLSVYAAGSDGRVDGYYVLERVR